MATGEQNSWLSGPSAHRRSEAYARNSAEDQADADERSDQPERAAWPLRPDQNREEQRHDCVEQYPPRVDSAPNLKIKRRLEHGFHQEKDREHERECYETGERIHEQKYAGRAVDQGQQDLPQNAADAVCVKREQQVRYPC